MERVMLETDDYCGRYVAFADADHNKPVGSGATPAAALQEAGEHGFHDPIIMYVPEKGVVQIYVCQN